MTWLGMLLIGVGVTDLVFSARPARYAPQLVGALAVVVAGQLLDLRTGPDLAATMLIVGAVLAWGSAVTWGFGRGPAWFPLALLVVVVALPLVASPLAGEAGGLARPWQGRGGVRPVAALPPRRRAPLRGLGLVHLPTGHVLLRLVLAPPGHLHTP